MGLFLFLSCGNREEGILVKRNANGNIESILIESKNGKYDNTFLKVSNSGTIDSLYFLSGDKMMKNSIEFYDDGGVKTIEQYCDTGNGYIKNQIITFNKNFNIINNLSLFAIINKIDENEGELIFYSNFLNNKHNKIYLVDSISPNYMTYEVDSVIELTENAKYQNLKFNLKYSGLQFNSYYDSTYKTATGFYIKLE